MPGAATRPTDPLTVRRGPKSVPDHGIPSVRHTTPASESLPFSGVLRGGRGCLCPGDLRGELAVLGRAFGTARPSESGPRHNQTWGCPASGAGLSGGRQTPTTRWPAGPSATAGSSTVLRIWRAPGGCGTTAPAGGTAARCHNGGDVSGCVAHRPRKAGLGARAPSEAPVRARHPPARSASSKLGLVARPKRTRPQARLASMIMDHGPSGRYRYIVNLTTGIEKRSRDLKEYHDA